MAAKPSGRFKFHMWIIALIALVMINKWLGPNVGGILFWLFIIFAVAIAVRNSREKRFTYKNAYMDGARSDADIVVRRIADGGSPKAKAPFDPSKIGVPARDLLDFPDAAIDQMIRDKLFDAALKYAKEMESMAKQMQDEKALRRYKIYEEVIAQHKAVASEYAAESPTPKPAPQTATGPQPAVWAYDRSKKDTNIVAPTPPAPVPQIQPVAIAPAVSEPDNDSSSDIDKPIDPKDYQELISL